MLYFLRYGDLIIPLTISKSEDQFKIIKMIAKEY